MNIKHQSISENTKSDVITSKVASLTVSAGNRNCCNAALLDIKWFTGNRSNKVSTTS